MFLQVKHLQWLLKAISRTLLRSLRRAIKPQAALSCVTQRGTNPVSSDWSYYIMCVVSEAMWKFVFLNLPAAAQALLRSWSTRTERLKSPNPTAGDREKNEWICLTNLRRVLNGRSNHETLTQLPSASSWDCRFWKFSNFILFQSSSSSGRSGLSNTCHAPSSDSFTTHNTRRHYREPIRYQEFAGNILDMAKAQVRSEDYLSMTGWNDRDDRIWEGGVSVVLHTVNRKRLPLLDKHS